MDMLNKLQRKGITEEQKRMHEDNGKQLEKLDMIIEGFNKAQVPVPELDRIRKALKEAHKAVGSLFIDETK